MQGIGVSKTGLAVALPAHLHPKSPEQLPEQVQRALERSLSAPFGPSSGFKKLRMAASSDRVDILSKRASHPPSIFERMLSPFRSNKKRAWIRKQQIPITLSRSKTVGRTYLYKMPKGQGVRPSLRGLPKHVGVGAGAFCGTFRNVGAGEGSTSEAPVQAVSIGSPARTAVQAVSIGSPARTAVQAVSIGSPARTAVQAVSIGSPARAGFSSPAFGPSPKRPGSTKCPSTVEREIVRKKNTSSKGF